MCLFLFCYSSMYVVCLYGLVNINKHFWHGKHIWTHFIQKYWGESLRYQTKVVFQGYKSLTRLLKFKKKKKTPPKRTWGKKTTIKKYLKNYYIKLFPIKTIVDVKCLKCYCKYLLSEYEEVHECGFKLFQIYVVQL